MAVSKPRPKPKPVATVKNPSVLVKMPVEVDVEIVGHKPKEELKRLDPVPKPKAAPRKARVPKVQPKKTVKTEDEFESDSYV